jgi:hypothetical protein
LFIDLNLFLGDFNFRDEFHSIFDAKEVDNDDGSIDSMRINYYEKKNLFYHS